MNYQVILVFSFLAIGFSEKSEEKAKEEKEFVGPLLEHEYAGKVRFELSESHKRRPGDCYYGDVRMPCSYLKHLERQEKIARGEPVEEEPPRPKPDPKKSRDPKRARMAELNERRRRQGKNFGSPMMEEPCFDEQGNAIPCHHPYGPKPEKQQRKAK